MVGNYYLNTMGNNTRYTKSALRLKYENLVDTAKTVILWQALDYMQQYNGRSKWDCIFYAMGYVEINERSALGEELWVKE